MNTHADKSQENKSQAVANSLPKLQSESESTFQFVDNRPEAIAQRKLQEAINNSPRVQPLKAYQEMANNSPQVKQLRASQLMADNFTSKPVQQEENNTGLPDNLKSGIENLSGYSMDDVKVHYNSDKPAQLQAHAYAQGTDIHLASGQEKHLPHEAWHVVQQKQGRVQPTVQMKGGINVNDDVGLEKEADIMGEKSIQLKTKQNTPRIDHQCSNLNLISKVLQPMGVVQMRTSFDQQIMARKDANYIVNNTTAEANTSLQNRRTFNAAPGGDAAIFAAIVNYRTNALLIIHDFGNVLNSTHQNGFTNYFGDGLDAQIDQLAADAANLRNLRNNNTEQMVDLRKLAMFNAVAANAVRQNAYDYNGLAFRQADTIAAATAALQAWETHYFSLSRARIIGAAKTRAYNGAPGNATVWNGLSAAINGYNTHMTIYNNNIPNFANHLVTAATNRADSDLLADNVLANGAGQLGIHLTAEINAPPAANPRVFGNPPDVGRHSVYILPSGMVWANFVAPLAAAQLAVRNDVWILVNSKVAHRN